MVGRGSELGQIPPASPCSLLPSGSHSPADSGVHLLPGAGEDQAPAAEHTAQALHSGTCRGLLFSAPSSWLSPQLGQAWTQPLAWDADGAAGPISSTDLPTSRLAFLPGPQFPRFVWWSGLWKDHVTVTLPGIWPVCWICRMGPLGGSTCVGQRRGVCRGAHLHGGVSGMGVSAHSPTPWGP